MPIGQGGKRRLFPTRAERAAILARPKTFEEKMVAAVGRRRVAEELAKTETDPKLKDRILTQGQIRDKINEFVLELIDKSNEEIVDKLKQFARPLIAMALVEDIQVSERVRKIVSKIDANYVRDIKIMHYKNGYRRNSLGPVLDLCAEYRKEWKLPGVGEVRFAIVYSLIGNEDLAHRIVEAMRTITRPLTASKDADKIANPIRQAALEVVCKSIAVDYETQEEKVMALLEITRDVNDNYIKNLMKAPAGRKFKYLGGIEGNKIN